MQVGEMPQQMPPMREIAVALRKTTETLAQELAVPANGPPAWTEFEWQIARAASAMQGVSSLLYAGARWQGPDGWRRFLHEQWSQSVARHAEIARRLDAIDSQARLAGVAFVALKGAALHATGVYGGGERPMGDIDLLVRHADAEATARVLEACGYAAFFAVGRHQVFQPRASKALTGAILGEHIDSQIKVEVHTRIAESLPVAATDITQFLLPLAMQPGLNAYPSPASLMMHLLLHAAGNMRARALRLIQLHDVALLAGRFGAGDWRELLAARPNGRPLWWAFAPLRLAARYYPASIPPELLATLDMQCPWLLNKLTRRQHLTDVSWSNIRIEAFPGLEWSRTPAEALEFMRQRIWPSREARLQVEEVGAQIPGSSSVPWYGVAHGARILRWIFSHPPRVQTLLSVRAALGQGK
jgi:hypothetical protein